MDDKFNVAYSLAYVKCLNPDRVNEAGTEICFLNDDCLRCRHNFTRNGDAHDCAYRDRKSEYLELRSKRCSEIKFNIDPESIDRLGHFTGEFMIDGIPVDIMSLRHVTVNNKDVFNFLDLDIDFENAEPVGDGGTEFQSV